MHNPFLKRFREFISAPSHSRTISAVVILIIAAAVPLTVLVAQKQQEIRQHAVSTGSSCTTVGAKSCNGNIPMVCLLTSPPSGKYWQPAGAACTYGCLSTGTCAAAPVCKAGTGSTIASCGGHDRYTCTSTTNCEEYTFRCSGSSCVSGAHQSVAKTYCAKGSICNPNTVTPSPTCTNGTTRCVTGNPNVVQFCSNNVWNTGNCGTGYTCSGGKCLPTPKCTEGHTQCVNSGSYIKCISGAWSNKYVCSIGTSCQQQTGTANPCKTISTPTPAPTSPCSKTISGKYVIGGVCSGSSLYTCNGSGGSTGSKVCTYGCQVNTGTYDTCKSAPAPTPAPTVCKAGTGSTIASCGGHDRYSCTSTTNCEEYTFRCSGSSCVSGAHQSVAKTYCAKGSICNPSTATPTPTPIPNCNASPQLSACVATASNTCSANNGTQTAQYTTYNGSTTCNPVNTTQPCTVSNCDVGNICTNGQCVTQATPTPVPSVGPTPTPAPGDTLLAFTIGIDAIGSTGDNVNSDSSSSTQNPLTPTRNLTVQVLDSNNNLTANQVGSINYNTGTGLFTGTINLGQGFIAGDYTVKVSSDGHLRRIIPGIQNITLGQTVQMPRVNLVAGDVDSNNILNINDYNIVLSCVNDPDIANIDNHALCNTNASYAKLSDLDDNGTINKFDYNLFLREYSVQNGD